MMATTLMDEEDFPINLDTDLLQHVFDEFDDTFEEDLLDFSDEDMWLLQK